MNSNRQKDILNLLKKNRMVKSADLKAIFHVSMETIRRDLESLERQGYVTKVYGGAILKGLNGVEPEYEGRGIKNFHEKREIACAAAELVDDGDTIFIDVGTTALEFARELSDKKDLTVFTNSIPITMELMKQGKSKVFIVGGEVRAGELSSSGPAAEEMMKRFYVDKLFMGIGGISLERGVCDYHMAEASLRRLCICHAQQVIGLADYSKFGITALNAICPLQTLNCLVTDIHADRKLVNRFREMGILVRIAGETQQDERENNKTQ